MKNILDAFLDLGDAGLDAYMIARARFFRNVGLGFLLVIFQCMMNYWDYQWVNIAIFYALFGLTMYALSHPTVVAVLATLEAFRKEKTANPSMPPPENINYFALYSGYLLLWLSIVSMFMATLPLGWYLSFREAMGVTFTALIFVSVIGWAAFNKWIITSIYKKIVTRYAIAGFLVCAWMIIPASLKYAVTGWEFYGPLGTSERAKAMSKAKRKIEVTEDKKNAERILSIGQKLAKEERLSKDDQDFWEKAQEKLRRETLPSRVFEALSSIDWPDFTSASVPPPPPVAPPPPPAPQYQPPIQTAMLPGEQPVAVPPPQPTYIPQQQQPETLRINRYATYRLIWKDGFQECVLRVQLDPTGNQLVMTRWPDGRLVAELAWLGGMEFEGSVEPAFKNVVNDVRIHISFRNSKGGRGEWINLDRHTPIEVIEGY